MTGKRVPVINNSASEVETTNLSSNLKFLKLEGYEICSCYFKVIVKEVVEGAEVIDSVTSADRLNM